MLGGIAFMFLAPASIARGAVVVGTVTDADGKVVANARIDHTGKKEEVRTDVAGHFRVVTAAPAIVVRMPGYESQRLRVDGDAQVSIRLKRITSPSRCKLSTVPVFKTKEANDIDYTARWFYIETKSGPQGIISGRGPSYSWGTPGNDQVWKSVEYTEIMYESGIIDASGHSSDGKYWRLRGIFGAASQYYNQTRETAEQLDCVMDRVPLESK
jgi:hypothetical protein